MSLQFNKLEPQKITFVQCGEAVNFDDMVSGLTEFIRIEGKNAPHHIIVDVSPIRDVDLTFREMLRFIPFMSVLTGDKSQTFRLGLVKTTGNFHPMTSVFVRLCAQLPRIDVSIHKTLTEAIDAFGVSSIQVKPNKRDQVATL